MLDHAGGQSGELLVVFHELFVDVTHPDRDGTAHVLVQSRQRETPFVEERSLLRAFVDFGIDEGAAIVRQFGMVLAPRRAVDDEQADVLADLRCGQPHAVGFAEREEHVFDQFCQAGVIGRDIFGRVAQRLRTVNDNRVNHGVIRFFP